MKKRVAIFQNTLTGGGRIQVVHEIIALLNEWEIRPDVYTLKLSASYRPPRQLAFQIIKLPQYVRGFYELNPPLLNFLMRRYAPHYDLLINSNNTLLFAPEEPLTIDYIHFPRETRILFPGLLNPDKPERGSSFFYPGRYLYQQILSFLYRRRKILPNQILVANSQFTRDMFLKAYPAVQESAVRVIYPPVHLESPEAEPGKQPDTVISLGRFGPDKRQLEQIQIAEKIPALLFRLVGFVGDRKSRRYFKRCQAYLNRHNITNVKLYPNLPEEEKKRMLLESKFFLHTLRNEPFGISTVEAIAAGCIPVVHDSGGQKEIVPFESLRFQNSAEAVAKIQKLLDSRPEEFTGILKGNLNKFAATVFREKMTLLIQKYL